MTTATQPAPAGQVIGYRRVSDSSQNLTRQLDGVHLDKVYEDKASGKSMDRPALAALIEYARAPDTVVVHSMDRLARNLTDLRAIVTALTGKGVRVKFVKEALEFSADEASPMSNLMLNLLGAFGEFERELIRERQREGIEQAKKRGGVYLGRKPSLTGEQIEQVRQRAGAGESKAALAKSFNVSRQTIYAALK